MSKKEKRIVLFSIPIALAVAIVIWLLYLNYPETMKNIGIGFLLISFMYCGLEMAASAKEEGGVGIAVECRESSPEFRRPIGLFPSPGYGGSLYVDFYGHKYYKYGDTWFDDEGNACPSYMESYYGLPKDDDSEDYW